MGSRVFRKNSENDTGKKSFQARAFAKPQGSFGSARFCITGLAPDDRTRRTIYVVSRHVRQTLVTGRVHGATVIL